MEHGDTHLYVVFGGTVELIQMVDGLLIRVSIRYAALSLSDFYLMILG
jgi:hypothetical protein